MAKYRRILPAVCCIAALSVASAASANSFDGTYTGKRILTKGAAQSCPADDAVSVIIKGNVLTFTNSNAKNYTVSFNPRPDGTFGQLSADVGGDVVLIQGHIGGNTLDADVTSAHCEHHWHLERS